MILIVNGEPLGSEMVKGENIVQQIECHIIYHIFH